LDRITKPGSRPESGILSQVSRRFGFDPMGSGEDFHQQCFIRMWKEIKRGRDAKPIWEKNFNAALNTLATAVALDLRRSNSRQKTSYLEDQEDRERERLLNDQGSEAEEIERELLTLDVQRDLYHLPPMQANVVQLLLEGYDISEIASLFDISASMVNRHRRKGVQKLYSRLAGESPRHDEGHPPGAEEEEET
jgi:RNA polymerase sigma factor (sigma-70 family)